MGGVTPRYDLDVNKSTHLQLQSQLHPFKPRTFQQHKMAALDLPTDLSLLTLSHPLLHPSSPSSNKRTSDSSDQTPIHPTPALLAADLQHYQDLFSKLRFSYVEQVTKERFLRAITSDPPEFVRPEDNAVLEAVLAREKAALKERKTEVKEVMDSIEEQGRSLAQRESQFPFPFPLHPPSQEGTTI